MSAQLALSFDRRSRVPYYATTPLTVDELATAIRAAERQDEAVIAIFRSVGGPLGPSQVHRIGTLNGLAWPPTSARRSITNLTDAGVLVRLNQTRMGPLGRHEYLWQLRSLA